jgi:hypothetical protein
MPFLQCRPHPSFEGGLADLIARHCSPLKKSARNRRNVGPTVIDESLGSRLDVPITSPRHLTAADIAVHVVDQTGDDLEVGALHHEAVARSRSVAAISPLRARIVTPLRE